MYAPKIKNIYISQHLFYSSDILSLYLYHSSSANILPGVAIILCKGTQVARERHLGLLLLGGKLRGIRCDNNKS